MAGMMGVYATAAVRVLTKSVGPDIFILSVHTLAEIVFYEI